MRTRISRGLLFCFAFGAVTSLLLAGACGYDPNPQSGMLMCGPQNSCPDNYSCMSGRCWRNGAGGTGGSSTGGGGRGGSGMGGTGGSSSAADKFVGHWVSNPATAKRVRVCTDGTNETIAWNDYLDIARGATTALTTSYYCDWDLDLAATGNATTIHPGASCTHPDVNDPTITYTWRGEALTLTITSGNNATLDMSLPYDYVTSTSSGSCTMHFTGPMTKQ